MNDLKGHDHSHPQHAALPADTATLHRRISACRARGEFAAQENIIFRGPMTAPAPAAAAPPAGGFQQMLQPAVADGPPPEPGTPPAASGGDHAAAKPAAVAGQSAAVGSNLPENKRQTLNDIATIATELTNMAHGSGDPGQAPAQAAPVQASDAAAAAPAPAPAAAAAPKVQGLAQPPVATAATPASELPEQMAQHAQFAAPATAVLQAQAPAAGGAA